MKWRENLRFISFFFFFFLVESTVQNFPRDQSATGWSGRPTTPLVMARIWKDFKPVLIDEDENS